MDVDPALTSPDRARGLAYIDRQTDILDKMKQFQDAPSRDDAEDYSSLIMADAEVQMVGTAKLSRRPRRDSEAVLARSCQARFQDNVCRFKLLACSEPLESRRCAGRRHVRE